MFSKTPLNWNSLMYIWHIKYSVVIYLCPLLIDIAEMVYKRAVIQHLLAHNGWFITPCVVICLLTLGSPQTEFRCNEIKIINVNKCGSDKSLKLLIVEEDVYAIIDINVWVHLIYIWSLDSRNRYHVHNIPHIKKT